MADELRMARAQLLRNSESEPRLDAVRESVRVLAQALKDRKVAERLGAERHERTPDRTGQRNGYRDRLWDARVGSIDSTPWSDSTRRSNVAPTWSASSPTRRPSPGWSARCWPNSTTSGRSAAALSAPSR